jgi:hypothetical protein
VALVLGVPALLYRFFPDQVRALLVALARSTRARELAPYHEMAFLFAVAGGALFIALANVPATASPVVIVCSLLFGLLAVYGFLRYAVSRTLPVVLGALAVLGLLGGLNPYKFRFPNMDYQLGTGGRHAIPGVAEDEADWRAVIDRALPDRSDRQPPGRRAEYRARLAADREALWQALQTYPLDLDAWAQVDYQRQADFDRAARAREARVEAHLVAQVLGDQGLAPACAPAAAPARVVAALGLLEPYALALREDGSRPKADPELDALKASYQRHNRVLPGKDVRPGVPLRRGEGGPGGLLTVEDLDPPGEPGDPEPLVVVAVSGGGLRSAAWTLRVLQELELAFAARGQDFPAHVRLVVGASGGMLGAAYYVTTLPPRKDRKFGPHDLAARRAEMRAQYDRLTRDCLTPIAKQLVFNDLPLLLAPWPAPYDRGQALEDAWRRNLFPDGSGTRAPLDVSFGELRAREAANDCPSLVFSPMLVEDGRRLLVSNLDLRFVASNDGGMLGGDVQVPDAPGNYSHEALELFRLFPEFRGQFQVGTAARMSASFPFFSPAVPLPTAPRRRVVDAGYYDNYGVSLASAWLFDDKHQRWLRESASKVVLVQIRDGFDEYDRRLEEVPPEGSTQVSRSVEELTSPLEGLDNARIGSSSFRNDGQVELLSAYYRNETTGRAGPGLRQNRYFSTAIFEFPCKASLSWHLTPKEKELIDRSALGIVTRDEECDLFSNHVRNRIDALLEWWDAPVHETRPPGP